MIISNFRNNEAANQFEIDADAHLAFVEYYSEGDKLFLTHTEVPHSLRGQGVAGHLIENVLVHARKNGLTIVPLCSYVAYYINNNPGWDDVLSEGYKM